ncbi:MAG: FAD-dependent oxidoreductase, partial [Clostridia bacterium]
GDKMKTVKNLKKFRNERRIVETLDYMKNLVLAGVDMFDVDLGCYDNWWLPHPPASMPSGCFLEISALVKQFFAENNIKSNAGLDVPVVAVGKLGYPDLAEKALREDKCDMIMLARPLLADPNWAKKAYKGECEKITPCIGCQECIREFVEGGHPQCAVNPLAAFEDEMKKEIEISKSLKRVAVVGGGPGGIVCANTLIKRGHKVVLFEKSDSLGGMLEAAGKPKIKYEIGNYKQYLEKIAERLQDNKNFSLKLSTKMTTSQLKDEKFDVIVTATGATPVLLPIDGIKNKNVFDVTEVLNSPKLVENFNKIIIIGGGDSGCELAYFLKYELKKEVTIIEKEKYLMANTCTANRGHLLYYLDKAGCSVHNLTKVLAIRDNSVKISKNISKNVPNPFDTTSPILPENIHNPLEKKIENVWTEFSVACDCVVVACSVKSNNELYLDLVKNNAAKEIYNIGDSNRPGKIFSVVKSAYRTARNI